MKKFLMRIALFLLSGFVAMSAHAAIPDSYAPWVVEAPFSLLERVFDLTPAVQTAQKNGQALFIYLGAADCPPCVQYKQFLKQNAAELKPAFANMVVVDIRTWLRGPTMVLKINDQRLSFKQFKTMVGDSTTSLLYPSFWLLSPDLKQIKQLPSGASNYLSVEQHLEILKLPGQ